GWIGRHAIVHDPMIPCENRDERPVDRRLRLSLPGGQEPGDVLEPPKRPRRFGQHRLAGADSLAGRLRFPRHERDKRADRVERWFLDGHSDLNRGENTLLVQHTRGRYQKPAAATRLAFAAHAIL